MTAGYMANFFHASYFNKKIKRVTLLGANELDRIMRSHIGTHFK